MVHSLRLHVRRRAGGTLEYLSSQDKSHGYLNVVVNQIINEAIMETDYLLNLERILFVWI